jgi:hypothetical protein
VPKISEIIQTVILTAALLFSLSTNTSSQSDINLKAITFSFLTAESNNSGILKHKIDKHGFIIAEPGLLFSYEFFVRYLIYSLRVDQAVYLDAAGMPAGYTGFGFRARIFNKWKHSVNIGFGTAFHYRKSWTGIPGYTDDKTYSNSGNMQYYLKILTGGIEYNYYFNERIDLSFGLSDCYKNKIMLTAGFRYWFSKKFQHHGDCDNCPKF